MPKKVIKCIHCGEVSTTLSLSGLALVVKTAVWGDPGVMCDRCESFTPITPTTHPKLYAELPKWQKARVDASLAKIAAVKAQCAAA